MTRSGFSRTFSIAFLVMAFAGTVTQLWGTAHAMSQSCDGKLQYGDNAISLAPEAASKSPWCSAYIGEDMNSPLAKSVLRKCPIGTTCRIAGEFTGHGTFIWTKLTSVTPTKLALPGVDELLSLCSSAASRPNGTAQCMASFDAAFGLFLTATYRQLRDRVSGNARKALVSEQTKWLADQSKSCAAQEADAKQTCRVGTTLERIALLKNRR